MERRHSRPAKGDPSAEGQPWPSRSPDRALGTSRCGAVPAAGGTKMEKDLVSALKEPWWR